MGGQVEDGIARELGILSQTQIGLFIEGHHRLLGREQNLDGLRLSASAWQRGPGLGLQGDGSQGCGSAAQVEGTQVARVGGASLDGLGGANTRTRESSLEKIGSARMAIEAGRLEVCRWRRARLELEGS